MSSRIDLLPIVYSQPKQVATPDAKTGRQVAKARTMGLAHSFATLFSATTTTGDRLTGTARLSDRG